MNRLVCDASALVAMLTDGGQVGLWAADTLRAADLLAPHLAPFEATNVLRRLALADQISADVSAQAHADLLDLPLELWPFHLLASRAWQLRRNLTTYDASYVALAEATGAPLVTLDRRMVSIPDARCDFLTPVAGTTEP